MFSSVAKKASNVINENRGVVNYTNYVTSDEHKQRMKTLPKRLQIARDKWFSHRNWHGRIHMPQYHVHFRQDMQEAVKAVVRSFQTTSVSSRRQSMQHALRIFQSNLRSLSGHVGIEERHVFPLMSAANPDLDLKFLWEDHEELHEIADEVARELQKHIRVLAASKEKETLKESNAKANSDDLISLPVPYLKAMLEAAAVPHTHCVTREDLRSLLAKHEATVLREIKAALRLASVSTQACMTKADVARLYMTRVHRCHGVEGARVLKAVLDFDVALLTHLGEEEELVVPMELQDRRL